MIVQVLVSFIATCAFAFLFHVPKKEIVFFGITGASGWLVSLIVSSITSVGLLSTFFGSLTIAYISGILARIRKVPITIFVVGGFIPLVPGSGIYNAMYSIVINSTDSGLSMVVNTLKVAGVIGLGIIIVFSLPSSCFTIFSKEQKK